ncbi:hypothetical protein MBANPS3_006884 [Mucor bainieri]
MNVTGDYNVTINNNNKRPHDIDTSPSDDSESSLSAADIKRARNLDYFHGPGIKAWDIKKRLVMRGMDLSYQFKKFRTQSIKQAEETNNLNSIRVLALSHIFPVNRFVRRCCISYYMDRQSGAAVRSLGRHPKFLRAPAAALTYCKAKADAEEDEDEDEDEHGE